MTSSSLFAYILFFNSPWQVRGCETTSHIWIYYWNVEYVCLYSTLLSSRRSEFKNTVYKIQFCEQFWVPCRFRMCKLVRINVYRLMQVFSIKLTGTDSVHESCKHTSNDRSHVGTDSVHESSKHTGHDRSHVGSTCFILFHCFILY